MSELASELATEAVEVGDEVVVAGEVEREAERVSPETMRAVRELMLVAHPDVVPELVEGATLAELLASLEPARAAFQRIAAAVGEASAGGAVAPTVPAGGAPAMAIDPERLPAAEKIRQALASRRV